VYYTLKMELVEGFFQQWWLRQLSLSAVSMGTPFGGGSAWENKLGEGGEEETPRGYPPSATGSWAVGLVVVRVVHVVQEAIMAEMSLMRGLTDWVVSTSSTLPPSGEHFLISYGWRI
jgi:hypothetical protein